MRARRDCTPGELFLSAPMDILKGMSNHRIPRKLFLILPIIVLVASLLSSANGEDVTVAIGDQITLILEDGLVDCVHTIRARFGFPQEGCVWKLKKQ